MGCLDFGYFSRSTVKPLDKIFDLDDEKRLIASFLEGGEWFLVSGVRRVGKTTLVRSLLNHLGLRNIYINLWGVDVDRPFDDFVFKFSREVLSFVDRSIKDRFKSVEEVSIWGLRVKLKHEDREFYLDEVLEDVAGRGKVIIVLDEIQEMERDMKKFARFLSSIHDSLAPKVGCVLLGSIASIRRLLDEKIHETEPLFGRIIKEFNIKPFDRITALEFLKRGLEECKVDYHEGELQKAIDYIGTVPGWLVEFGREYVLERSALGRVEIQKALETIFHQAKKIIYGEIARILKGKRRFDIYIKILKIIANTPYISLTELSNALNRKKPTILQYIEYLEFRNIVKSENGHYNIVDPLYIRAILTPNFEREVKKRLLNL